jgi:hypothetical protein
MSLVQFMLIQICIADESAAFAGCSEAPVACSYLTFAYLVTHQVEVCIGRSPLPCRTV